MDFQSSPVKVVIQCDLCIHRNSVCDLFGGFVVGFCSGGGATGPASVRSC